MATIGIELDTIGAGEAVTVVERKIRQIKERVRAVISKLPFRLTEKLEGWLVRYAVNRIVLGQSLRAPVFGEVGIGFQLNFRPTQGFPIFAISDAVWIGFLGGFPTEMLSEIENRKFN